jgi:hypothetical protein
VTGADARVAERLTRGGGGVTTRLLFNLLAADKFPPAYCSAHQMLALTRTLRTQEQKN